MTAWVAAGGDAALAAGALCARRAAGGAVEGAIDVGEGMVGQANGHFGKFGPRTYPVLFSGRSGTRSINPELIIF